MKYYSPLHVSSLKCSSSGRYSCIHTAHGTVTVPYAVCIELYHPEDEHLRLETCRGE